MITALSIQGCSFVFFFCFVIFTCSGSEHCSDPALVGSSNVERPLACHSNYSSSAGVSLLSISRTVKRTQLHRKSTSSTSHWEDGTLKVVYGIFTSPLPRYAAQLEAVLHTWGAEVFPQKLLVVGVRGSYPDVTYKLAPHCKDGHVNNDGISCKEATLLAEGYRTGADWVVVLGSDNYVFPRNFEKELRSRDPERPQILALWGCGKGYCEDKQGGLCGGGGYAISRSALDAMIGKRLHASKRFVRESIQTAKTSCGFWSDMVTSCIARRQIVNIEQVNLTGLYAWRVCPRPSNSTLYEWWLAGTWFEKLYLCDFNHTLYREKMEASSPAPLTFHYIRPREMYRIHYMKREIEAQAGKVGKTSLLQLSNVKKARAAEELAKLSESDYEHHRLRYIRGMHRIMTSSNGSLDSTDHVGNTWPE
mmetsp:Transcript_139108/g.242040  ORF Transcript_139108/g.242040 Transcript_139108/m.242040 type:complete len:420 (-) Transcript_139108:173-1432(-)